MSPQPPICEHDDLQVLPLQRMSGMRTAAAASKLNGQWPLWAESELCCRLAGFHISVLGTIFQ